MRRLGKTAMYVKEIGLGGIPLQRLEPEDVKAIIGRSPDHSDTYIMRMYFLIKDKMQPKYKKIINNNYDEESEKNPAIGGDDDNEWRNVY